MKYKYLVLVLALIGVLGFYLYFPISADEALERAEDELSFYCTDLNLDCSKFKSIGLVKDEGGLRIYEWEIAGESNPILQVRVPHRRVGDVTFGFLGVDVTIGTLTR